MAPKEVDVKRLESAVLEQWQADLSSAFQFGTSLLALKAAYKLKGQFAAFLRKNKINRNRAYYALALATGKRTTTMYHDSPRAIALNDLTQIGRSAFDAVIENDIAHLDREEKKMVSWFAGLRKKMVVAKAA
jgi:hypothetical protein